MSFIYDITDYHIFAKIVITILVGFVVGYPIFLMSQDITMTIWGTILFTAMPMGMLYGLWVD